MSLIIFFLVTSRAPPLPDLNPRKGTVRPRSDSPFDRNLRARVEEEGDRDMDMEAISCLLDFAMREPAPAKRTVTLAGSTPPPPPPEMLTVRTFSTTRRTADVAPRPERPPPSRIVGRGHLHEVSLALGP